jgi:hypothetical protein
MNKIFTAFQREAALVAEQMCNGATLISKANYARQGLYLQLFFSLSIAFERAAKLIIVIDQMLETGAKPNEKVYRQYKHDINRLFERVGEISKDLNIQDYKKMPNTQIHDDIITILHDFACNVTRYYNLDVIGKNNNNGPKEPVSEWHHKVTLPLFETHVSKRKKESILRNASNASFLMEGISLVRHTNEAGGTIDNVLQASYQTGLLEATAPYTRLYVLQICRFLSAVLSELGFKAMKQQVEDIPCISDFFRVFGNKDSYFKSRKTWKIE